jgi:signal peptidase I
VSARARARSRGHHGTALALAGVAAVLLLVTVALAAEPFAIPSESMAPTLRPGDHVLVDKVSYRLRAPRRGELAVFRAPDTGTVALKRIVAVAGDRVAIEDGVLVVGRQRPAEPYVDHRRTDSVYFGPVVVAPSSVFVLGDNRGDSHDSRDFGAVPTRALIGRVLVRFWPPRG